MFKIYDRRNEFYQWDLNQKLIVDDITITQVHFCNKTNDCSLVCEVYELDGLRVVDVPNILLQYPKRINVYAYCSNYTKVEDVFRVIARTKPSDYIYTETEAKTFAALEARMANVEQNGVPQDVLNAAIDVYFDNNPIETGATAAQAAQIEENKKDIAAMEKAAASYALKSELPSTEGLATEEFVNEAISNIELPSGGGSSKFVLLHNETIEITEPVKLITKTLQNPVENISEFIVRIHWTANANTETNGNDTLYLRLADCQAELGDGSSAHFCLVHLIPLGEKGEIYSPRQMYYESVTSRATNELASNANTPKTRYAYTMNFVGFETFAIAVNSLAYQGTIEIQILGR